MNEINDYWINSKLNFVLSRTLNVMEDDITKASLLKLVDLDLSDNNISDLKGIEYATNLKRLNLCRNDIEDASILSNLTNLRILELSENRIYDASFLTSLTNLQSVGLDSNNISEITDLSNLNNLEMLNVSNNQIYDLSFLNTINSNNIKVLASEQCVVLNPIIVEKGQDYIFDSPIYFNDETVVLLDNIQVSGKYESVKTNKRPSILYSISKVSIKNILSKCFLRANFYHEVPFKKSAVISGTLLQQIDVQLKKTFSIFDVDNLTKGTSLCKIYGKICVESISEGNDKKIIPLSNEKITIINSFGEKIKCSTNENGFFQFNDLKKDRYTLLFPFLNDYTYITPSLVICNLKTSNEFNVDCKVCRK